MCLTDVEFPIAYIVGTATPTRGRSGYGVHLYTGEQAGFPIRGESETLHTPLCATASGVLAVLRSAQKRNLPHIFLAFQSSKVDNYLRKREYPDEPEAKELFRQIYENPVQFDVYNYKGNCKVFIPVWDLARMASGTHSLSPNPINDNLYKNGVIGVTVTILIKGTEDGGRTKAWGYYFEQGMLNDWGVPMNEALVIPEAKECVDVCVEVLDVLLFATQQSRHFEVRIKTASRTICELIEDFKKTGLKSYKRGTGIYKLRESLEFFDRWGSVEVEYTADDQDKDIRDAHSFTLDEFNLREDSMYWKNGIPRVYTDGACSKKRKKDAVAGCGVFWGPDNTRNAHFPIPGRQTNNRAEFSAVIHALETALEHPLDRRLNICTDSEIVLKTMNEHLPKWKRNRWTDADKNIVENQDLVMKIYKLMKKMKSVKFEKVVDHSGHEGNDGANALAKKAVEEAKRSK